MEMFENINILNELKELDAATLINTDNQNYFSVPENYFDALADDIRTRLFISLLPATNPYYLQDTYFENLSESIIEKIQLQQFGDHNNVGFSVPNGYFDNLATTILNKIKVSNEVAPEQELNEISPLLASISKKNIYSVPENYFSELSPFPEQTKEQAKVVSFGSRFRKWTSYAAAACIGIVLFGGGYRYFNRPSNQPKGKNYPEAIAKMDVQKEITSLSDDEINHYLKNNNNMAIYTNSVDADEQPNVDVQTLLQNVSDDEIQQYLNQEPEAAETGGGI